MNAPFEIDPERGTLKFAALGLTLTPKQSLDAFLATDVGTRCQNGGANDGWQRYYLARLPLKDGQMMGISLYFFHACLAEVRLGYRPGSEAEWSTWSKDRERDRVDLYQREIVRQLGRRGRFHWGLADAGYDDKAASAILFVRYGPGI
jgi:hypothetical protein